MKHLVKMVIKYLYYGIAWGCTVLVFSCLIGSMFGGEDFLLMVMKDFTKQAIGAMLVGIGCGSVSIVYEFEKLPEAAKRLIHFGVGMGVFYPTALYLGWIPFYPGNILYTISQILISCGIFVAIWLCFYLFNRGEAKKINDSLRELEKDYEEK